MEFLFLLMTQWSASAARRRATSSLTTLCSLMRYPLDQMWIGLAVTRHHHPSHHHHTWAKQLTRIIHALTLIITCPSDSRVCSSHVRQHSSRAQANPSTHSHHACAVWSLWGRRDKYSRFRGARGYISHYFTCKSRVRDRVVLLCIWVFHIFNIDALTVYIMPSFLVGLGINLLRMHV